MDIVVCGGSVIGSAAALMLAGDGHQVTVLESDSAAIPDRPADAWDEWERTAVPQFHQPHNLFARFRQVMDEAVPGLTGRLADAGCTWVDPLTSRPPHLVPTTDEDDDRFRYVTGRRPVIEAVLVHAAAEHPGITMRRGARIVGLRSGPEPLAGSPHVTGVTLESGEQIRADVVVDAMGRRTKLADWLAALGARSPLVESEDSGFVYHTRYFTGPEQPATIGPTLMPLGSISLLTLPGDNDTWSVTVWGASADQTLKKARDPERWTALVQACPLQRHWLDGEPITEIVTMAGILDRYRRFVVDDAPVATGVVAVGDAWACTNPSAGRGISVGALHAMRLRDAIRDAGDDPEGLARRFDELTETEVAPFVRNQMATDRARIAEMTALRQGHEPPAVNPDATAVMAAAMADDRVFKALVETVTCLALPQEAYSRDEIRPVIEAHRGAEPVRFPGPDRAQLVELLG